MAKVAGSRIGAAPAAQVVAVQCAAGSQCKAIWARTHTHPRPPDQLVVASLCRHHGPFPAPLQNSSLCMFVPHCLVSWKLRHGLHSRSQLMCCLILQLAAATPSHQDGSVSPARKSPEPIFAPGEPLRATERFFGHPAEWIEQCISLLGIPARPAPAHPVPPAAGCCSDNAARLGPSAEGLPDLLASTSFAPIYQMTPTSKGGYCSCGPIRGFPHTDSPWLSLRQTARNAGLITETAPCITAHAADSGIAAVKF